MLQRASEASTDHAMTISNLRRLASLCMASKPGRLSRPSEPLIRGTPCIAAAVTLVIQFGADWRAGLERAILAGMAYEYRVTEAADGTLRSPEDERRARAARL